MRIYGGDLDVKCDFGLMIIIIMVIIISGLLDYCLLFVPVYQFAARLRSPILFFHGYG